LFWFLLFASWASAQTISPLSTECPKKCSGQFTVTNNGLRPMRITVEKHSFDVKPDGTAVLRALDAGVDVELGASSTSVGPQQSHTFFYRATCATLPCRFELLALTMNGEHTAEGLQMALALGTAVYVCEKKKDCRLSTLRSLGYDPPKK
jgi:hypothetical protein